MSRKSISFLAFASLVACSSTKKMTGDTGRLPFNDEAIYTGAQPTAFQYFRDGAKPVGGLTTPGFQSPYL